MPQKPYFPDMTKDQLEAILEDARSWPRQDREELAEAAREIQARRSGAYTVTAEERTAIMRAQETPFATEDEVESFWRARGVG